MSELFIGIDLGTTAIKISVVDQQLNTIQEEQIYYEYLSPQKGWTEIEPETWYELVMQGLKQIFINISANDVSGIGVTGQMHTTVFLDQQGKSVRPAILWNDSRTQAMIPGIKEKLLQADRQHLAKIVSTGSPLANLLWVQKNEPENYQRIAKFLIAKDYLNFRLTGTMSTDYCDASTSSMYDLQQEKWSKTLQEMFGISEILFPPINPSAQIIGELKQEICQELGLKKVIPVVAGTGDNAASAIALESFENEQPFLSLGTSGVVVIPNKYYQLKDIGKNVVAKINETDRTIITQGTVQAGAKVNSWWTEQILQTNDFTTEQGSIDHKLLGRNEVLFFPHLNGEKTLFANSSLRGAFVGMSLETSRAEMYLAVLEGLAFGIKTLFEAMKNDENPEYFTIVGGGAKSELWVKIFANVLGIPIKRQHTAREAVQGAAILAILGVKKEFCFPASNDQMVEPEPAIYASYQKKYKRYKCLSKHLVDYSEEVDLFE